MDSRFRTALATALHVFALVGFAVAQPLYELLGRSAEFFIAHDARPFDLIALVGVLSVGLPVLIVAAITALGLLWRRVGGWALCCVVGILSGLTALPLLSRIDAPGALLLSLTVVLAVAAGLAYSRIARVREFLTWISPAALLFPILFLFFSPVEGLLLAPAPAPALDAPSDSEDATPVVFVIFDSFPVTSLMDASRRIDAKRYPNLAALSDDAWWFRDATTVATTTNYAIPAILTGRYANRRRLPTADDYPGNLFTLLGRTHALNAHEIVTRLCPAELCRAPRKEGLARTGGMLADLRVVYLHIVLPADLTAHLPSIRFQWKGFGKQDAKGHGHGEWPDTAERFAQFLESMGRHPRGTLHFIHLVTPHAPWRYLPSGREYGPTRESALPRGLKAVGESAVWLDDEWPATQALQRHLLQAGFADHLIGDLVARLRELGLYKSALIVVVADHGVSFRTGETFRDVSPGNLPDILRVPLLMKLPGQEQGELSDRNVETVDILPSIATALGVDIPWRVRGHSAIDARAPERIGKTAFHTEAHNMRKGRNGGLDRARRIDFARAKPGLQKQALARMLETFGSGTRGDLFRFGRHAALIGNLVGELPVGAASHELELEHPEAYEAVDLESGPIPALVRGHVRPASSSLDLAVAINGTIRAVTKTDATRDGEFSAMVPEGAFTSGSNRVEVFVVVDGPRLEATR